MFSMIEALLNDPKWFLEFSLYRIPAVLIALILHEWAHGYVAYRLGDPTAKQMGRLSLNPLRHLDPVGTLMMFFLGFGWAKPVPVNPNNFKNPRRDDILVSLAGITMNLLLFLLFTLLTVAFNQFLWDPRVLEYNTLHEMLGFRSGAINVILSGYGDTYYADLFARPGLLWVVRLCGQISMVNMYIAIFNLLPVPPLDGSHVAIAIYQACARAVVRRKAKEDAQGAGELAERLHLSDNTYVSPQVARASMGIMMLLSLSGVLGKAMSFLGDGLQSALLSLIDLIRGAL